MRLLLFLTILLSGVTTVFSQRETPFHYTIQTGLSAQLLYDLEEDSYGRMLIATEKGLYRYTGYRVKHVLAKEAHSPEIIQLDTYKENIFALNRSNQLFQLRNDQLILKTLNEFEGDIRNFAIEGELITITGSKWVFEYELPTFQLISKEPIPFTDPIGTQANQVYTYKKERFAVLNTAELVEMDEGASRSVPRATGRFLLSYEGRLMIIPSYTGEEPVHTYSNGLFRNWGVLPAKAKLQVNRVQIIDKDLVVMSDNGLYLFKKGIRKDPVLWFKGIPVSAVYKDKKKNWWVATKGKGLIFVPASKQDIINPASLIRLHEGSKSDYFGSLISGTINHYDVKGNILKSFANPSIAEEALPLYVDSKNNRFFTTTGIFELSTGKLIYGFEEPNRFITVSERGVYYFAKPSGVYEVFLGKWNTKAKIIEGLKASKQLSTDVARQVEVRPNSNEIAIVTIRGVYLYKEGEQVEEVRASGKPIGAQSVRWFKGELYVATNDNELLKVRHGRVVDKVRLSQKEDELVLIKMLASTSHLFFLTEKSLYRLNDINEPLENLRENVGFDGVSIRDFCFSKNHLLFATQRGVMKYDWKSRSENEGQKPILVVGQPYGRLLQFDIQSNGNLSFKHYDRLIKIPLECVDLTGNVQLLIQYAIHTKNERGVWSSLPISASELNLDHLGPGDYQIDFCLYDPVSQTKTRIQSEEFSVQYAWYNHPTFRICWLLASALIIVITWRWSLKTQRRRLLKREEEEFRL